MEVVMLLCDWAEEINGKLYIMGAGWTRLVANQPANIALAISVAIPWDQTNTPYAIKARLLTEDGASVTVPGDPDGRVIEIDAGLEVGRPPGTRKGTPVRASLAMRVNGLALPVGHYSWRLDIDEDEAAVVPFDVVEGVMMK